MYSFAFYIYMNVTNLSISILLTYSEDEKAIKVCFTRIEGFYLEGCLTVRISGGFTEDEVVTLRHISLDFKELYSHLSGGERNCFNQFPGQIIINSDDYSSEISN